MAARTPKSGDVYVLLEDHGNGVGAPPIPAGSKLRVREVVPADEPGAHDDSEDAIVFEYGRAQVREIDGEPSIVYVPQAFSLGVEEAKELVRKATAKELTGEDAADETSEA